MDSYLHTPMNTKLIYESIPERFSKFTQRFKNREAFVFYSCDGQRTALTFQQLYDQSVKFAKGLVSVGLKPGDIVGLGLPNTCDWAVCHFGIYFAGCISMGLTFGQKDGVDVKFAIENSGKCKALIFDGKDAAKQLNIVKHLVGYTDYHGKVPQSTSSIKGLEYIITTTSHQNFPFTVSHVQNAGSDDIKLPVVDPDAVCLIFQTSGATGLPKLVQWTHSGVLQSTQGTYEVVNLRKDDVFFNPGLFAWGGAYIHGFLVTGCTYVTLENFMGIGHVHKLSETFLEVIKKEKCTHAFIIPYCLYEMIKVQSYSKTIEPLKGIIVGGHPVHRSVGNSIGSITEKLFNAYGCTETAFIAMKVELSSMDVIDFNCGPPIPGVEIKVLNEHKMIVSRDVVGHIYVRSRTRFQGYVNQPKKTALAFSDSGWYDTQDRGYVTQNGDLVVLGRKTELISNAIGLWFSPGSIESLLMQHKEVKAAAVIPIPDETVYQKSCACIIRDEGSTASWDEISSILRDNTIAKPDTLWMDTFIPDFHVFVESFPRTISGKIRKQDLYEQIKHLLK